MDNIIIKGLSQNNLKSISLSIPKNKIVVFTGVSGSGKSSIVFDTIAAESQRQMNETYSAWIRGRLPKYDRPKVESIENLSASVIVDQTRLGGNSRSTVGTISDMYSLLRLIFSRVGKPHVGTTNAEQKRTWNTKTNTWDTDYKPFTVFKQQYEGQAGHFFASDPDNAGEYGSPLG